ncbi:unnamed protein product [Prorocentrum cordatum]|uniref:Altered inheritance of mitochondria protein 24, mitochondrial n=1 Tax=Prorocentrum cordatum TaxID=2364126 RepID=A0ABN9U560_9DINO|nr:unnamed protein product [Polarella glacialis]
MLTELPEEYKRTAVPVMLKMLFVEDIGDVTEVCPHDSERVETMGDNTVTYAVDNSTVSVDTREATTNKFMGMSFGFVSEAPVGHTLAFEISAETQIVWVTREEMVQVLQTQDLPASAEARLEAQLRSVYFEKGMDDALTQKGKQEAQAARADIVFNRRGKGDGRGAVAMILTFLICAFTVIGCLVAAPFLMMVGTTSIQNGACSCWVTEDAGQTACSLW